MRRRNLRRLLERRRRARARVTLVHVPRSGEAGDGGIGTKQVAEVELPRAELDKLWSAEYLERLARTYWYFLSRISLHLLRVLYTESAREVVLLTRPFVLLRFRAPEYDFHSDGGTVTWPIESGVLVARGGRRGGYLRLTVTRASDAGGPDQATVLVSSEVVNFYPGMGNFLYERTQLRIHVIVTHAFLRSLANLELQESVTGAFRPGARPGSPAALPDRGER